MTKCLQDLKYLEITETLEEIEIMTKGRFNRLLKDRSNKKAFKYLTEKLGGKNVDILPMLEVKWQTIYCLIVNCQ